MVNSESGDSLKRELSELKWAFRPDKDQKGIPIQNVRKKLRQKMSKKSADFEYDSGIWDLKVLTSKIWESLTYYAVLRVAFSLQKFVCCSRFSMNVSKVDPRRLGKKIWAFVMHVEDRSCVSKSHLASDFSNWKCIILVPKLPWMIQNVPLYCHCPSSNFSRWSKTWIATIIIFPGAL